MAQILPVVLRVFVFIYAIFRYIAKYNLQDRSKNIKQKYLSCKDIQVKE